MRLRRFPNAHRSRAGTLGNRRACTSRRSGYYVQRQYWEGCRQRRGVGRTGERPTAAAVAPRRCGPAAAWRSRWPVARLGLLPRYDGYGTAAIPNTILAHFGVAPRLPPLAASVLPPDVLAGARTIVLLIIDALGYDQLARGLATGALPKIAAWLQTGRMRLTPLTTIFPSTTAAAMTTYATGEPPSRHGMAGYTLWLDEARTVVNMIRFAPEAGKAKVPGPDGFLPVPTVAEFGAAGVPSAYVNLKPLLGSGLSVMHGKGADQRPVVTFADLCCTVRQLVEARPGERQFIQAYWDAVDTIAHLRGPRGRSSTTPNWQRSTLSWAVNSWIPSGGPTSCCSSAPTTARAKRPRSRASGWT